MIDPLLLETIVEAALREDIGLVDLTSELVVPAGARARFVVASRQDIVLAGTQLIGMVFRRRVPDCVVELAVGEGERIAAGGVIARVQGEARGLLTAERTALNLLQHMSGIATLTARYVDAIKHTKARLVDTRKTTPGLRAIEKHAAMMGGARNHRLKLDDGVMIKDNHIAVCGGITAAVARAKAGVPLLTKIEVEVDRLDQLREAIDAGADIILLDNMSNADLREAVAMTAGKVPLEASGGVNLDTIAGIAETGVDFISVGRITQSAPAVDIGLDVELEV